MSSGQAQTIDPPPPVTAPAPTIPGLAPAAPPADARLPIAKTKPNPAPPREKVVAKNDPRPSLHPDSLLLITEAASRYQELASQGGWPILPATARLSVGMEGEFILHLRARLAAERDLAVEDTQSPVFDPALAEAVKRFQARHGLARNGIVSGATLKALRVPAEVRARQLKESAKRLSAQNFAFGARYVVVNIPSAAVEAVAGGTVGRRYVAVVGKADRPSPEVETRITNVNFNPTWTVPISLIKKDIIPKMRKDPAYLAKSKIRIFGASGQEIEAAAIDWSTERAALYTLRQDPGVGNSLGQIRIDMPNKDAVYMHDTPSKRLFARDERFHSSGCVRIEDVKHFVGWLLDESVWDKTAIEAATRDSTRRDVHLKQSVPVIWTYLTGYVTEDNTIHFRDDVYGLDQSMERLIAQSALPAETPAAPPVAPPRRPGAPSASLVQRIDP